MEHRNDEQALKESIEILSENVFELNANNKYVVSEKLLDLLDSDLETHKAFLKLAVACAYIVEHIESESDIGSGFEIE